MGNEDDEKVEEAFVNLFLILIGGLMPLAPSSPALLAASVFSCFCLLVANVGLYVCMLLLLVVSAMHTLGGMAS